MRARIEGQLVQTWARMRTNLTNEPLGVPSSSFRLATLKMAREEVVNIPTASEMLTQLQAREAQAKAEFARHCSTLLQESIEKLQSSFVAFRCTGLIEQAETRFRWAKDLFEPKGYVVTMLTNFTEAHRDLDCERSVGTMMYKVVISCVA